jgi:hypothetical protein
MRMSFGEAGELTAKDRKTEAIGGSSWCPLGPLVVNLAAP